MTMNPLSVRPMQLLVDELIGWFPTGNFSLPVERNTEQAQPIIDQRSLPYLDRQQGDDMKVKFRWRDSFQIPGVGKKGEDLLYGQRQSDSIS